MTRGLGARPQSCASLPPMHRTATLLALVLTLAGCPKAKVEGPIQTDPAPQTALAIPPSLAGRVEVLPDDHPEAAAAKAADLPPGQGGVEPAIVVKLTADVPVWRLWSGPDHKNAQGFTNRIGQWWSADAPTGTQAHYREAYAICAAWNELTHVAACELKAGTVVAIGPGAAVSAETCANPAGPESYPANPNDWQIFLPEAWKKVGGALVCPPEEGDRLIDPNDLSR